MPIFSQSEDFGCHRIARIFIFYFPHKGLSLVSHIEPRVFVYTTFFGRSLYTSGKFAPYYIYALILKLS